VVFGRIVMSLEGKVALITGAKGGLGSAVTSRFLDEGATVAGVSRSIRDDDFADSRFFAVPAELSTSEAAQSAAQAVISRAGRIDILVHLVGGFAGGASVAETDEATLDQMWDVNVKSAFYVMNAVLPHMRSRQSGRLVAIGSRAAAEASPNAAAYSASKAALVALVRAVAAENADAGISANVVMPATIDTAANRMAMPRAEFTKWVHPEQIARLIVSLCADDLSQVTGAAIPIYGRAI
jgi:NAD(P)-dependent dehydrogenase (short-subunit alcohol dehydrogenase family)